MHSLEVSWRLAAPSSHTQPSRSHHRKAISFAHATTAKFSSRLVSPLSHAPSNLVTNRMAACCTHAPSSDSSLNWLQPPLRTFLVSLHLGCLLPAPIHLLLDSQLGLLHLHQCSLCRDHYLHENFSIFKCLQIINFFEKCLCRTSKPTCCTD